MFHRKIRVSVAAALVAWVAGFTSMAYAQSAPPIPTNEQLSTLLAPIALYPDTLLAQICTAAGDPQQVLDVNNWVKQNSSLTGTAINDAAQQAGFDPAFIALVTFPSVLDQMAQHIDDYAAIGAAFRADQASVTAAIQALRQQAYASGALDSNEYQKVSVEQQNGATVVIVQPTNPQVVYVPQYEPAQVYSSGPSTNDVLAASLVSFSVGIAVGAIISNNQPWGWSSWGWGWGGGGGVYYRGSPWGWHYGYHSPYPPYRPRPPYYGRPIYPRPPPNWNYRPGYRPPPPGYRPPGPNRPPGYRPPPGGGGCGRPPGSGGNPPLSNGGGNGRPPGQWWQSSRQRWRQWPATGQWWQSSRQRWRQRPSAGQWWQSSWQRWRQRPAAGQWRQSSGQRWRQRPSAGQRGQSSRQRWRQRPSAGQRRNQPRPAHDAAGAQPLRWVPAW